MIIFVYIALVILWLAAWAALSIYLGNLLAKKYMRTGVTTLVFTIGLALPFVDEVVGEGQFKDLCEANQIRPADASKAHGKKLKIQYGGRIPVSGTWVPVEESDVQFRDATSGELLFENKNYYASGGWVERFTPLGVFAHGPMLFVGNGCGFAEQDKLFTKEGIAIVN